MKRLRMGLVTLFLLALLAMIGAPAVAMAQPLPRPPGPAPARPAPASVPPAAELPIQPVPEFGINPVSGREVLRVGQDYALKAGDTVGQVAVIFGNATIDGRVEGDVVVVFGKATLSTTAAIDGSLVVFGGSTVVSAGARVDGDVVVVGGGFDAPAVFTPGGAHIVIGPTVMGGKLDAIVPWITRGLLWGRPIVPDLAWVWWIVGIFFLAYLVINLVFNKPVHACAATMAEKPLTTFMVGLLVLLLVGPVCVLLAVSVIGLAVVPFVLCALVVGGVVGKVGTAKWIGMSVVHPEAPESRMQSLAAFAIGFGVIVVAYMIPVLGFVTFALLSVIGLGAAMLAFITAYRREHPAPPPREKPVVHQAAWVPPPVDAAATPESPATVSDLAAFPRAAFRDRLAAFVLDLILVVFAYQILDVFRQDNTIFLLLLAYHIGFWTWKGSTVGGIICQLRVVRVDGARLTFADALVRGLASIFSLVVLGIGCLWMLRDPERQTWHDRIAGTYVVKVPRNWPL